MKLNLGMKQDASAAAATVELVCNIIYLYFILFTFLSLPTNIICFYYLPFDSH